ncbi:T9SS type A sorting domain-containing protein [Cryomorphaceae bacterium 1068]|nr:T9SS type A sorting domain-containing protein [Cryomorphaceae bacterium 1068]
MRTFLSYSMTLISILVLSPEGLAQDGIVQLQFSATQVSGKVFLDWTMNFGQTCNGIDITRSTDNINFSPVGNIQGICGSPTDTVSYSFIDESPILNQVNYYRLLMGNLGPSQTISVEIINLQGTGYQVRPNPIVEEGRIYFDNDRSEEHRLTLISTDGSMLRQLTTRNDFFVLNTIDLSAGIYIFRIETADGSIKVANKLVVAK